MSEWKCRSALVRAAVSLALKAAVAIVPIQLAVAQQSENTTSDNKSNDTSSETLEEVVVTGFRQSLNVALEEKRNETAAIDSIVAEDIGKFPDSNLAESMQRIPGVTLSRGDGGEGRQISVRGLGPAFTRVRINGMEGASQTGSSDIYGAGNNGRSFDFNVFPTEIFSALAVRKTPSADVEEGSLGATIDLKAPRPLDFGKSTVFTATTRGVYNTVSEDVDPRLSLLAAKDFRDGTFGVLGSLAYQKRNIREVGYSAVDLLSTNSNGLDPDGTGPLALQPFCTPVGWTPVSPSPTGQANRGATLDNCSTDNPRSGSLAAYQAIYNMRRPDAPNTPGSGAFIPRIPRYVNSEQDAKRMGGTFTVQWKPDDNTNLALDTMISKFDVERRDNYISNLSFGRNINNNGQPMVSVVDAQFDQNGSLMYGLFDGVDVRSEGLVDQFTSKFQQANLDLQHRFSDTLEINALVGYSESSWDGPMRLQTFLDAIDQDGFSLDFRDGESTPLIGFGELDVSDPTNFTYAPNRADGTVVGGFSTQGKPSKNLTKNTLAELSGTLQFTDALAVKVGAQYREADFNSRNSNLVPSQVPVQALPPGVSVADISRQITNLDDLWGRGAPASWVAVDPNKWREVFNFDAMQFCGIECGAAQSQIKEEVQSGFAMLKFGSADWLPLPIRGDVGVRYVHTDQLAVGHIPVNAPAGAPFPSVGQRQEVERSYADWLPSANVVLDITPELLARFSAAKVMSRPELGNLTPSASVTATTRTATVNNPLLDPIRAKTFDVGLEWYYREGSLLSVAYFYKDIDTFIQRITSPIPFSDLGLPDALLAGTASAPSDIFNVSRFENTPGGPLKGFELNAQAQLSFLPGIWRNLGVLANYTHVTSDIEYILTSANGVVTSSTVNDLTGLSRNSASGTLFYEDDRFSIRTTGSYRGKYIRGLPASPGSDLQGNKETLYVDASASYRFDEHFNVLVEAQNLTNERNVLFIDSVREDTLFETTIGRTYTVGATYRF
jgi:iron complex outermembrane recepter protein